MAGHIGGDCGVAGAGAQVVDVTTQRKPKTPADYAIWRARVCLDWIQASFDGSGDYPFEYLAGHVAAEMRLLTAEANKRKNGWK